MDKKINSLQRSSVLNCSHGNPIFYTDFSSRPFEFRLFHPLFLSAALLVSDTFWLRNVKSNGQRLVQIRRAKRHWGPLSSEAAGAGSRRARSRDLPSTERKCFRSRSSPKRRPSGATSSEPQRSMAFCRTSGEGTTRASAERRCFFRRASTSWLEICWLVSYRLQGFLKLLYPNLSMLVSFFQCLRIYYSETKGTNFQQREKRSPSTDRRGRLQLLGAKPNHIFAVEL